MKCVVCHGDHIEMAEVVEEIRRGTDIVQVPVQVPVCRTCGERYYDRRTIRLLEQIDERLRKGTADLQEVGRVLAYR